MENEKKMEESNGSERSKVWYNIYNIVKQIPRKEVNCDAVDAPSAATMIEQLFLNLGNVDLHSQLNLAELKKEFEKLFMVTDRTEMKGTAVNAKLNDVFEWMEQKVKHVKQPLPTMDIYTVKEIIKLCTVLHDNPNTRIEEASGIDLVRMQLEDVLITLKEKKKWENKHY